MTVNYRWKTFSWYNKPKKSDRKGKKKMVLAKEGDKVKLVHYWATWYTDKTKWASKKQVKSTRARHKCDQKKSKLTAWYWACKDLW